MSDKSSATDKSYVPPLVWAPEQANGGAFASINKPTAGATHQQTLPRGEHALQLYSLATPNGMKVSIMLEELIQAGIAADYDAGQVESWNDRIIVPALLALIQDQETRIKALETK